MAGLLAAGVLRKQCCHVLEKQPSLPNNHSAVLRFRTSIVGDALNIPFKEVQAIKAVAGWRNPIADAMAYSLKTNGEAHLRSVLSADGKPQTRYIAPPDLIRRMAGTLECPLLFETEANFKDASAPTISTIPMPALMDALGYDRSHITFRWRSGFNIKATLKGVEAYCSLYVPDPAKLAARISITGDQLVVECYDDMARMKSPKALALEAADMMGVVDCLDVSSVQSRVQSYAKILPIPEDERRKFIMWASETHRVYSLGRFATWRPGLLLDDVVNDVRVIQRLIVSAGATYNHRKKG